LDFNLLAIQRKGWYGHNGWIPRRRGKAAAAQLMIDNKRLNEV